MPLDEERVRFVWEQAVIPHIEDLYFGDEARLKEFSYDRLMAEITGAAPVEDTGQANDGGYDASS